MIDNETKRKLREMNMPEMIDIIESQDRNPATTGYSFDERLREAIDYIYHEKNNNRIKRLLKSAHFRIPAADLYSVVYEQRGFTPEVINNLRTCSYIRSNTSVIIQGFTGSGKTFLSCALGKAACENLYRVFYIRLPDLLIKFDEAAAEGTKATQKLIRKLSKYDLLILDEWLMETFTDQEQHFLFELVEHRYDNGSFILCTQYRKEDWLSRLGANTHAEAIMDRIVHNAIWIDTGERNMRELR